MSKVSLTDVTNLENQNSAIATMTANNDVIETAFDNTLSRDGTSPNQMGSDFDMNSHRILNLPAPVQPTDVVRLEDLQSTGGVVSPIPKGGSAGAVLEKNSGTDYDWSWSNAITNTTISGLTITTTTGTLSVAAGKTVTQSNTLSYSGTDGSSIAFGTGGTVAYTQNNLSVFASTTSAQLAGVISDETGSGSLVFATSPTLVTPVLGAATATTINKVTITQPAASATLTIANTKTLNVSNTLTLAGTDSTTITFQGTDTYVGRTTTDTLTNKTISGSNNTLSNIANSSLTNSTITIGSTSTVLGGTISAATGRGPNGLNIDQVTGHGDSNYTILSTDRNVFTTAVLTATRTWTLPAANSVNAGQSILIADLAGGVTSSNLLTVQSSGTDTINGTTSVSLSSASTSVEVISDGTSKWYAVQSSSGGGGSGASSFKRYEYTATAGQTTFLGVDVNSNTLLYTPGFVIVTVNGDTIATADYTATSGTSIVFSVGRAVNDQVSMIAMNQSAVGLIPGNNLSDVVSKATSISNLKVSGITTQTFTSGTAATYTTPANCTWIEVYMVGGGGGGAGCFNGVGAGTAGSNGTKSSFNGIDAAPGLGGQIQVSGTSGQSSAGGAGGTGGTGTATRRMPGQPGHSATNSSIAFTSPAAAGGSSVLFGGGGAPPVDTGTHTTVGNAGVANTGGGGSGAYDTRTTNNNVGSGGGAGESVYLIINSPSPTYTYTVGTGGTGGVSSTNGGAGAAGQIQVIEHYGLP